MARTKGGYVTRRSHKKILSLTKGQWGSKHRLFRRANEAMMKSLWYAYRDRRQRRRHCRCAHVCGLSCGVTSPDAVVRRERTFSSNGAAFSSAVLRPRSSPVV